MDFYSDSEQQAKKVDDEEYIEIEGTAGQRAERKPEERGSSLSRIDRKNKKADEESEDGVNSPTSSRPRSKSRSSNMMMKVKMPRAQLVLKILAVVAVYFNFKFILNFMKEPAGTFYHTLTVLAICAGINFLAVWILFSKRSWMRLYLSLAAILGAFAYYFYVNYTNHSFLGIHLTTSVLMILSVLMMINTKASYHTKSILLLLIPVVGIYISWNQFALVWALMWSAGMVLLFRVSKSKADKKEGRARRNEKQSA